MFGAKKPDPKPDPAAVVPVPPVTTPENPGPVDDSPPGLPDVIAPTCVNPSVPTPDSGMPSFAEAKADVLTQQDAELEAEAHGQAHKAAAIKKAAKAEARAARPPVPHKPGAAPLKDAKKKHKGKK